MKKGLALLILALTFLISCTHQNSELGSRDNPIKFYLVPAQDLVTLSEKGKVLEKYLSEDLKLSVKVELPINYITVVEAFGSKRADVAILNTLGYVLAHDKYGVEPKLKLVNRGRDEYYGQIIVRDDGPKTIKELNGKKFAYVDPASTSGYLLPARLFKQEKIQPKETIFAGKHDGVVMAVYQKKVDGGATFYTPPDDDGTPKDARWLLRTQYPDVYKKIKILKLTGPIPNDPIVFRSEISEELKSKITNSLIKYIRTEEGAKVFKDMYHITDFKNVTDMDYNVIRDYLKDVGASAKDFVK